jgi:hypothetical protein
LRGTAAGYGRFAGTVKAKLMPLIEKTKADELMITSMLRSLARKRSYGLRAKVFA